MTKGRCVLDLGGTTIGVGYSENRSHFEMRESYRTGNYSSVQAWFHELLDLTDEIHDAPWVIGVPGPCEGSSVDQTPNLTGKWSGRRLIDVLRDHDIDFVLENDANLAALGAFTESTLEDVSSLLCVTLGTGIGGGFVANGDLYRGENGGATEIGHIVLEPNGRPCTCGNQGCLEEYGSARGLEKTYEKLTGINLTAKEIAHLDSQPAEKTLRRTGQYLGRGLAIVTNVLNPEAIVFTGGLSKSLDEFRTPLRNTFRDNVFVKQAETTRMTQSALNNPALRGGLQLSI